MFHVIANLSDQLKKKLIEFLRCEINFAKHKELFLFTYSLLFNALFVVQN